MAFGLGVATMKIRLPQASVSSKDPERRHPEQVWEEQGGASSVGSTFWKGSRRCPRSKGLQLAGLRVDGFRPGRVNLDIGLVFHRALEIYYDVLREEQDEVPAGEPIDYRTYCVSHEGERQAWLMVEEFRSEPGYDAILVILDRMLTAYFTHYRLRDRFRVHAVEMDLHELANGFPYSARLDTIVEDLDNGGFWVLEHKSASHITENLRKGYIMDMQILGQDYLVRQWLANHPKIAATLPPFRGVIVNIVSKNTTPKLERIPITPSPAQCSAFIESMKAHAHLLGVYEQLGWPKFLGNCTGGAQYFSVCEFYDVCLGHPTDTVEQIAAHPPYGFTVNHDAPFSDPEEA